MASSAFGTIAKIWRDRDIVAVRNFPESIKFQAKETKIKYWGPFVIIEVLTSKTYKLEKLNKEEK